jgi:hypothetical protein
MMFDWRWIEFSGMSSCRAGDELGDVGPPPHPVELDVNGSTYSRRVGRLMTSYVASGSSSMSRLRVRGSFHPPAFITSATGKPLRSDAHLRRKG